MNARLIIFTRYPEPGVAKTRLIPALGKQGAADLQREMTEHTLETLRPLAGDAVDLEVRYTGADEVVMAHWLGENVSFAAQGGGDLGARMERAFREAFAAGCKKAVIVGTDCPGLSVSDVRTARELLDDNPMVLGPATDGGYYLIALRADAPEVVYDRVFQGMGWGASTVFSETMNRLADTMVDVGLLDEKTDVDEPEDLIHWEQVKGREEGVGRRKEYGDLKISVIIPVLNEEETIGAVIGSLTKADVEIVVADGGSTDRTLEICGAEEVKIVTSEPGRARQMNAGAAAAGGDILLFLHADTKLPAGFADPVRRAVHDGAVSGAFSLQMDSDGPAFDLIEFFTDFKSHRLGIVFGDQAIFATRTAFEAAGGYPDQPIMEDYELWRRLKRQGPRVVLPESVVTSARRYREYGAWRVVLAHHVVTWAYLLFKVSPERLARWYVEFLGRGKREEGGE